MKRRLLLALEEFPIVTQMTRYWKAGIAVFLAICASGLLGGLCLHWLKKNRLAQTVAVTRSRAEKGDAKSQIDLSSMYFYGKGVPQSYAEAARWCRMAAEQGNAAAEFGMGSLYYYGNGVPQDYAEAARWYRKAAEQGNLRSEFDLASMYYAGKGVGQDYNEAVRWYRQAAEQGDAASQLALGFMYRTGNGVRQDYDEAIRWYRKAASQGSAEAEYSIGYMYYYGEGFDRDYNEAMRWYRESANHGYREAQQVLRSVRRKSTIGSAIERVDLLVALVGGLMFSLTFLWPGRSFRNSIHATALGLVCLCYAGLGFYGVLHQYAACLNLLRWAQGILIGMALILAISIIIAPTKRRTLT